MKAITIFTFTIITGCLTSNAQTSPLVATSFNDISESTKIFSFSDTITFTPFSNGTIITNQYLNKGLVFAGYNGSTDPVIEDYSLIGLPYGKVLRSDNWYNALRINFVDTLNGSQYILAKKIEFDNVLDSALVHNKEVDYMSIDVYDSMDILIYHYLSSSHEHVVLNFGTPSAAYIVIDDSAGTAFVIDNILIDNFNSTSIDEPSLFSNLFFPNPFTDELNFKFTINGIYQVALYDITSRKLAEQQFTNSITLSTEQLVKGIYLYQVRNKNGVIKQGKVVKN